MNKFAANFNMFEKPSLTDKALTFADNAMNVLADCFFGIPKNKKQNNIF
jgi:hypothetical protein